MQNLNKDQLLPLDDASIDVSLIVAGCVLTTTGGDCGQLLRITRPGDRSSLINRMFHQSSAGLGGWLDQDHLECGFSLACPGMVSA